MWKIESCHFFLPAWNEKIGKIPLPPLAMMWCAKKSCSAKWQFSPSLNRGVGAIAEKFPIFLFQAWMAHRNEKIGNAILSIFMKTLIFQTDFSKKYKIRISIIAFTQTCPRPASSRPEARYWLPSGCDEDGRCTPVFYTVNIRILVRNGPADWARTVHTPVLQC